MEELCSRDGAIWWWSRWWRDAVLSKLLSPLGSKGERGGTVSCCDVELQRGAAVARDGVGGATLLFCLSPEMQTQVKKERKEKKRKKRRRRKGGTAAAGEVAGDRKTHKPGGWGKWEVDAGNKGNGGSRSGLGELGWFGSIQVWFGPNHGFQLVFEFFSRFL
ncbi:hypothetical protein JCGZ_22442 [Jatropha curcas]|uniref:Uncharacterized protein n=1 Tax=Jatropha curcas TaxID=180498 RepID=A0A067JU05_JATCU|nr:hypothetical protein JCGZ_22442 [Jatropha curcas]